MASRSRHRAGPALDARKKIASPRRARLRCCGELLRRVPPVAFSLLISLLMMSVPVLAQGPTYGIGRTPSAEEIRARDISIGPTGEELPQGKGSAKEGALTYRSKGCAGCHGANGTG